MHKYNLVFSSKSNDLYNVYDLVDDDGKYLQEIGQKLFGSLTSMSGTAGTLSNPYYPGITQLFFMSRQSPNKNSDISLIFSPALDYKGNEIFLNLNLELSFCIIQRVPFISGEEEKRIQLCIPYDKLLEKPIFEELK